MSTILKALKKLDGERRAEGPLPTLEEQVLAGSGRAFRARGRGVPWRPVLAVVGVVAVAGGLVYRLARGGDSAAPPVTAPVVAAPHPATLPSAIAEAREPAPSQPVAGTAAPPALRERLRANVNPARPGAPARLSPESEAPATSARVFPPATAPPAAAPAVAESAAAQKPRAPSPPPARVAAQESPPSETVPQRAPEPKPAPAPVAAAAPEAKPTPTPEPDVAVIAPRPELWVDRTQWHPSPEKRSALVRGADAAPRELREGDEIDGVLVKEIKPSGVIFSRAGDEWRRNVGSN